MCWNPRRLLPVFSVCLLTLSNVSGQIHDSSSAQIEAIADRVVRRAMTVHNIPGLVIGVVQNGEVMLKKGYGVKRLGGEPPDEDTVFAIGSLSKSLTAIGAMLLVDEGKVRLDDPISKYLHGLPREWQPITVRQYMTHTSGIPDVPPAANFEAAVRRVANQPLQFPPGTNQQYDNFNFAVIGRLIEVVTGENYQKYMHDRVFGPVGMKSTAGYHQALKAPDHATGYIGEGPQLQPAQLHIPEYGIPSGGMASTLRDLLALEAAIQTQKLMRPETYQQMYTRTIPPGVRSVWHFTPGWQARIAGGEEVVAKNGMVAGYASQYHFLPSRGIAVVLIWNRSKKGADLWPETAQMLWQMFGVPLPQNQNRAETDGGDD